MKNYVRDYRLEDDRPEMILVDKCDICGGEIYDGDTILKYNGEVLCDDCIERLTTTAWSDDYRYDGGR